jgi:hypothetical protein
LRKIQGENVKNNEFVRNKPVLSSLLQPSLFFSQKIKGLMKKSNGFRYQVIPRKIDRFYQYLGNFICAA